MSKYDELGGYEGHKMVLITEPYLSGKIYHYQCQCGIKTMLVRIRSISVSDAYVHLHAVVTQH